MHVCLHHRKSLHPNPFALLSDSKSIENVFPYYRVQYLGVSSFRAQTVYILYIYIAIMTVYMGLHRLRRHFANHAARETFRRMRSLVIKLCKNRHLPLCNVFYDTDGMCTMMRVLFLHVLSGNIEIDDVHVP